MDNIPIDVEFPNLDRETIGENDIVNLTHSPSCFITPNPNPNPNPSPAPMAPLRRSNAMLRPVDPVARELFQQPADNGEPTTEAQQ